ncbi:putative lipid II flippase FtsW [soil metagenome]
MTGVVRSLRSSGARIHEPDWWLLAIVMTLVMIGTVMVFSATSGMEPGTVGANSYLTRHLVFIGIGLMAMFILMHVDYRVWRVLSIPAILGTLVLLGLVLVIGTEVYGARRWFDLGVTQAQPSELAKPALVIYLASWLCTQGAKLQHWGVGLLQFCAVLGPLVGLVMLEPDMGTALVLATIGIAMMFVAGARKVHAAGLIVFGGLFFLTLAMSAEYRRERILAFLNPEANTSDTGWHLLQARLALGDGGLLGVGLGASRQKFTWLPAPHNDAIFAVIGEELGLIGAGIVILLFGLLGYRGMKIAGRSSDRFGMLVSVGISSWLMFQALFNIGGVSSAIPFTGITLPFISYGGSSMIVSLAAVGILLNVSRQTVSLPAVSPSSTPTSQAMAMGTVAQIADPSFSTEAFHQHVDSPSSGERFDGWRREW